MDVPFYCVKAFSSDPLSGSPAGIVLLNNDITKKTMQRIAAINGYPETVFLQKHGNDAMYSIWWFTPEREVFDAGHATLASQYILFREIHKDSPPETITLLWPDCQRVIKRASYNMLNYGSDCVMKPHSLGGMQLSGARDDNTYIGENDLVVVLENSADVINYTPDFELIASLPYRGLAVTANDEQHDYCCRFFAPKYGVNEDFTTASAHKYLALFWMSFKQVERTTGIQYSTAPGAVVSVKEHDQLLITGDCCTYIKGVMSI